jgi:hypothetical protein
VVGSNVEGEGDKYGEDGGGGIFGDLIELKELERRRLILFRVIFGENIRFFVRMEA